MFHAIRDAFDRTGALALGAALLAAGCSPVKRIPLREEVAQRLTSVRPVAVVAQQGLGVSTLNAWTGVAAGIGARHAEAKAAPVRDALTGWEPGERIRAALQREVAPIALLHAREIEVRRVPDADEAAASLLRETREDALFLVNVECRLSPAFDRIVITAKASLIPTGVPVAYGEVEKPPRAKPDLPPSLYENVFVSTMAPPGYDRGTTTPDEAAALWAANGGRAARRALDDGLDEVARMIAFDVVQIRAKGAPPPRFDAPPADASPAPDELPVQVKRAFEIRRENGRVWLRTRSGRLLAVEAP
jgi:hypothetical protein